MFADKPCLLVTNNRDCYDRYRNSCDCLFDESWDYGQVLNAARDLLHLGYILSSHPLAGSLKPNQTPYRSLVLTLHSLDGQDKFHSLMLLEQALGIYHQFQQNRQTPDWPEKICRDFRTIDLSLIEPVMRQYLGPAAQKAI